MTCPCGIWTPAFFCFADALIGCCFCSGSNNGGHAHCVDNKGNFFDLVRVDGERNTVAWFTGSTLTSGDKNETKVTCYCV
jgi:hypothetical protein